MATNYIANGNTVDYANSSGSDIESGDLVIIGERVGVAKDDIDDGSTGVVQMRGVFSVDKEASLAVTQGDLLYADATSGELDKTASEQTLAGYAYASAAAADGTVKVALNA